MKKTKSLLLALCIALSLSACSDADEKKGAAIRGKSVAATNETTLVQSEKVIMTTNNEQKNHVTYFIAPKRVDCTGVAPQKCLQVKTKKDDGWSLFYSSIEGFTFEEGYNYEIIVETEKIANPPMDSSSTRYTLVNIVAKEPGQ